jgi:putative oxidoreductase
MNERWKNLGLLLLRLAGLYLALGHGWGKIESLAAGDTGFAGALGKMGFPLPGLFAWAAALSEFLGGLLVAAGLFTRWAAGFAAITMAVAAFARHHLIARLLHNAGISIVSEDTLKAWGNPELSTIFLLVMLGLALIGPGGWSLDAKLRKKGR